MTTRLPSEQTPAQVAAQDGADDARADHCGWLVTNLVATVLVIRHVGRS